MSTKTTWKTRLTDKLREMIPGALVLTIASSVWLMGQMRESEADIIDAFAAPIHHPSLADLEYEPDDSWEEFLPEDSLVDSETDPVPLPAGVAVTSSMD